MEPEEVQANLEKHQEHDNSRFQDLSNSLKGITMNQVNFAEQQAKIFKMMEEHSVLHKEMTNSIDELKGVVKVWIEKEKNLGFIGKLLIRAGVYAGSISALIILFTMIKNFLTKN